ncbi:MAG: murein biosynthesis integral membrane protein MurJ [Bacillota bacterium]|jgi:putative peptidoglycan lipid II flippase
MGKSIVKATGVILVINFFVKILGFLRESFIANAYGAGTLTDAYQIAYTIPYFLQAILGYALVTAVVPVLTKHLVNNNKEEAWYVGSCAINITALGLFAVTAAGILISAVLVKLLAPGFAADEARLTVELTRIMFPSVIFMGVGMVFTGIANASYKFGVAAFAPGFSNIIIIASVVIFASSVGIWGLAVGTLVSFIGFFLIQIPVLWRIGFKYRLVLGLKHPDIRQIMRDILPIILGVAVNQICFAVNRIFASFLAEGSISYLNYSNKLMMLPIGIFVNAVAYAIYPSLSEMALKLDWHKMASTLKRGIGMVCLVAIPAAAGLCVLAQPVVQIVYERGSFDHAATLATAWALMMFTVGLVPISVNMVLTRAFYALEDVKTPVKIGAFIILVDVALSFALFKVMAYGGAGLALANSLALLTGTIGMYYYLKRKSLTDLKEGNLLKSLIKMFVSAGVMVLAVLAVRFALVALGIDLLTTHGALLLVTVGICVGVAVYGIMVIALKIEETQMVLNSVKKKFKKA